MRFLDASAILAPMGLDPAIHLRKSWMRGSSPRMTVALLLLQSTYLL
jgi:hypothetical protein